MGTTRPRRAAALRNARVLIVHPVGTTEDGIGVHMPPVYRLSMGAEAAEIGRALRESLVVSSTLNPPPLWQDRRQLMKTFLAAARVRSWRQLETNAVACWIREHEGEIIMTPLRNGGTQGDEKGFQPFGAAEATISLSAADAQLGAAVSAVLDRSE